MIEWRKYPDLEPIRRLKEEGRELLGKLVILTEKRDGSNVSIWLNDIDEVRVSSHNLEVAEESIINSLRGTVEYSKAVDLLKTELSGYNHRYILFGELVLPVGPTRIERRKKATHWILFDVYDCIEGKFLNYTQVYQLGYHYKIPIVNALITCVPDSLEGLTFRIDNLLKWCKRHRREGIVGKCYSLQLFFKEKIDLPKLDKIERVTKEQIQYPPMPEDRILRALQHALDEVGEANWKDKAKAMPIIAKQLSVEAREHFFQVPRNMYQLYLDTQLEKIRGI